MSDRTVQIRYSRDGGRNWSAWRNRSLGELGEFEKHPTVRRIGICRNIVFEWKVTSPVRADVIAAALQVEPAE